MSTFFLLKIAIPNWGRSRRRKLMADTGIVTPDKKIRILQNKQKWDYIGDNCIVLSY